MGRIKSTAIKKAAKTLVAQGDFTTDFEENKTTLEAYNFPDKGTRNKIAGYIARLKKAEKNTTTA
jgi:ribosomal protein S17E